MTDDFNIDWPHGHQTRDGKEVCIYKKDAGGEYCIHGAYKLQDGLWEPESWTTSGHICSRHNVSHLDLVNKPAPKRVAYVNTYSDVHGRLYTGPSHPSREAADKSAQSDRVGCVRFTEGQFDD